MTLKPNTEQRERLLDAFFNQQPTRHGNRVIEACDVYDFENERTVTTFVLRRDTRITNR